MKYVIVGGGIAAVSALKAIRANDPGARITLVSEEKHCFYYRPMTPQVIKGDKERDEILHDPAGLGEFETVHDRAVSLDVAAKTVGLQGGGTVGYDRLLVATGSSAFLPDLPGIREKNVHTLRTLEDAQALREAARNIRRAVILGGGFVGIKKALALAHHGVQVTVVEKEEHILLPRLDADAARIVAARLEARGISILTGSTITRINPDAKGVVLASGEALETDIVCIAVGVRPNVNWLANSGVEIDRALVVDRRMQTSAADVYAAGDVVQIQDLVTGQTVVSALWTNAVDMGKVAGINMAGGKADYPGGLEILNATEIEGLPMVSVGHVLQEEEGNGYSVYRSQRDDRYTKLIFKGDVLSGAIFMGDVARAGIYTSLIKTRKPLGRLKEKAVNHTLSYADFCLAH